MVIFIYALLDPRTELPFYVGKTNRLKNRFKSHRSGKGTTPCANFIRAMKEQEATPKMKVLEECNAENWAERERYWIEETARAHGWSLLKNVSGGGIQAGHFGPISTATRERLRAIFLGRRIPDAQKKLISQSLTGLKQSQDTVQKRLATINERRAAAGLEAHTIGGTEEERRKEYNRRSHVKQQSKARANGDPKRFSPEWKAKISQSMKKINEMLTPEQRLRFTTAGLRKTQEQKDHHSRKMAALYADPARGKVLRSIKSEKMKARLAALTPEQRESRMSAARAARKVKLGY